MFFSIFWAFITVPLSYYGAYAGYIKVRMFKHKVSPVRREIPQQPFWLKDSFVVLVGGFLIFSTIIAEFQYVLTSVWRSYLYGMFGILFINLWLLIIVIGLVSVLFTYLCLQQGNWAWWWRSFGIGYAAGLYLMAFSCYNMIFVFEMNLFWSDVVYLLYTLLLGSMFSLMCGAISLAASFSFLTVIY